MKGSSKPVEAVDFADDAKADIFDSGIEDGVMDYSKFRVMADAQVEVISEREFKETDKYRQFMQDLMIIMVHKDSNPTAPTHAFAGVNGEQIWLPRDTKVRLPRYMVERLARARSRKYQTLDNPDPRASTGKRVVRDTDMDYQFTVLHDPAPEGRSWLERVIRESR